MTPTDIYSILGLLHIIGFLVLLIVVKIIMESKIPTAKLMGGYILCFVIATMVFSAVLLFTIGADSASTQLLLEDPFSLAGSIAGEIVGLSIGFLIVDFVILTVGRWVYKKIRKEKTSSP